MWVSGEVQPWAVQVPNAVQTNGDVEKNGKSNGDVEKNGKSNGYSNEAIELKDE